MVDTLPSPAHTKTTHILFRRINWRQEYLHIAVGFMTVCFLTPWVQLTVNYLIDMAFEACLSLTATHLLLSMVLVRVLIHHRVNAGVILTSILLLMGIAATITVLLTPSFARAYGNQDKLALADLFYIDKHTRVPGGPAVIMWVVYLWWRGYQLGNVFTTLVRASFTMRLGILSFLWIMIFSDQTLRENVLPLVPVFFFCGLLASSLARADSLSLDRAHHSNLFGRGWVLSLVSLALIVTLGGFAASLWLTGINMEPIAKIFAFIMQSIAAVIALLAVPLLIVVQLLYDAIKSMLPDRFLGNQFTPGENLDRPINQPQLPWLSEIFQILSTALVAGLILFIIITLLAFLWFLFIARARPKDYKDEEREILGTGEVVTNLRQTLRDRWRRLADMLGYFRQFGFGRDLFAALTIRRIYAQMEKLAGSRGYPRAISETPYEYRRELYQAYPRQVEEFLLITEAYVAVRYGDVPESPAELDAVRSAWMRLNDSSGPADS